MSIKVVRETHETPKYVTQLLIRSFGLNKFKEPNYRVIWGGNRVAWVHGELDLLYRHIPARAINRWIIEKWLPAEEWWGPPETWEQTKQAGVWLLGPYPYRGEYEHVLTIEGLNDEFLQLTPALAQEIPSRIEKALQHRNPRLSRQYLYDAEAKKDEIYMRWADMILDDTATWAATPHIYPYENVKEKIS